MAITKAQQYKQMLRDGGVTEDIGFSIVKPSKDGRRPGYRFGDRGYQGGPSSRDVERPGGGGRGRDRDYQQRGESKEKYQETSKEYRDRGTQQVYGRSQLSQQQKKDLEKREAKKREENRRAKEEAEIARKLELERKAKEKKAQEEKALLQSIEDSQIQKKNKFRQMFDRIKGFKPPTMSLIEGITGLIPGRSLDEMYDQYIKDKTGFKFREYAEDKGGRELFKQDVLAGKISSKGGPMGGFGRDEMGNTFGPGGDGPDNQIIPQVVPTTTGSTTTTPQVVDNRTELEKLLDARGAAYRFFADGGMAEDDDPVGGIMDLESGRQMYFLGKLVKKVTRGVKKIAKSPVGKLALGAAAIKFGSPFLKSEGLKNFFFKGGEMGLKNLTQKGLLTGILGTSALAGLMTPKQEEDEEQYLGPSIDIPAIRRDPYGAMGRAYRFAADGGIMRMGYQDGSKEPVAKKTMPLLDMDGMEKDYRETGGFVEMGRMERADDVPARLSKNEFVFTADAVRNAGDGNIDKGAEVMYNMMKNLESGGEVSEESQGLEGARKMFQTSQRLGEVV